MICNNIILTHVRDWSMIICWKSIMA